MAEGSSTLHAADFPLQSWSALEPDHQKLGRADLHAICTEVFTNRPVESLKPRHSRHPSLPGVQGGDDGAARERGSPLAFTPLVSSPPPQKSQSIPRRLLKGIPVHLASTRGTGSSKESGEGPEGGRGTGGSQQARRALGLPPPPSSSHVQESSPIARGGGGGSEDEPL